FQQVGVERVAGALGAVPDRLDVVRLGSPLERQQEQEARERSVLEEGAGERGDASLVEIEIATERMPARPLEDRLRLAEQLLVLQLLLAEAEKRAQVRAVAVPVLLHGAAQVKRDELLVVAEQVHVAEGAAVIQRLLVLLVQEVQGRRAHPG